MVLHQDVAKIGQTALLLGAFAVKARILVRRRGDGLEKLEEQSPQKARSGGMDGRPIRSEGGRKSQVELSQRRIGQPPHRPQRVLPGMRASTSTYENSAPLVPRPRIDPSRFAYDNPQKIMPEQQTPAARRASSSAAC